MSSASSAPRHLDRGAAGSGEFVDPEPDHEHGPLRAPGAVGGLRDVWRHRFLMGLLVRKDLRKKFQGSAIGLVWSYIRPAVRFCVYFFIMGMVLRGGTTARGIQIFSGMIMVQVISESLQRGSRSIISNKALVRKINLPREMFPIATLCVSLVTLFPFYVIAAIGIVGYGLQDGYEWWTPTVAEIGAGLLGLAIVLTWGIGLALLLSALTVYFRDVSNLVDVINSVIQFTVPMIYPFALIGPKLAQMPVWIEWLYVNNPLCTAVLLNQKFLWVPILSEQARAADVLMPTHLWERGLVTLVLGFAMIWVGKTVFARLEGKFAEKL